MKMKVSSTGNLATVAHPQVEDHTLPESAVRSELERVVTSSPLRDSELLKRFLQYVVESTLKGEGDQLKEYRVGVEVFGRDASFDPKLDPVVRMTARRLRVKLDEYYQKEGQGDAVRIEVPKGGYAASFVRVAAPAITVGEASSDATNQWVPARSFVRRQYWKLSAALLLLLAIAAVVLYQRHTRSPQINGQGLSLAVLPFLNLTGNPENEYLSDGITDEVTGYLAQGIGLRVVARTSAFQFKGKSEDVRQIGKALNVASVLEGSLQAQGSRLRVTAQLIRTGDGYHVWSDTYEREFNDAFVVEDAIAHAVSDALRVKVSAVAGRDAKERHVDPVAHELYLRGQYMGQRLTAEDTKKGMSYFNQALDRDPLYAEAYAGLAAGYVVQGSNAWAPAAEVYPKARAAVQRAIELDSNLSDAHSTLAGIALFYDWDLPGAEREFQRAIELNPNSARAHQWYGILLYYSRRFDKAEEQFRRAKEVNPLAIQIDMTLVMLYEAEHNYDRAIELARRVLSQHEHSLPHALLGLLYADEKQFKDAIEHGQKAVDLAGNDPDTNLVLANIYAQAGQREKALAIVQEFVGNKKAFVVPFTVAGVYAQLADKEAMYQWLDTAIKQRSPACLKLNIAEAFDAYRSEVRFQKMLTLAGLSL
jgi:serine/threonine-protein kinase